MVRSIHAEAKICCPLIVQRSHKDPQSPSTLSDDWGSVSGSLTPRGVQPQHPLPYTDQTMVGDTDERAPGIDECEPVTYVPLLRIRFD